MGCFQRGGWLTRGAGLVVGADAVLVARAARRVLVVLAHLRRARERVGGTDSEARRVTGFEQMAQIASVKVVPVQVYWMK